MITTSSYARFVSAERPQHVNGSLPAVDAPYPDPSTG